MPSLPPGLLLLVLTGLLLGAAVFGAWGWAIARFASGRPLLSRRPAAPVPWGGPTAFLMIVLWLVIQVLVARSYMQASGKLGQEASPADVMTIMTLANAAALVALPLVLRHVIGGPPAPYLGLGRGAATGADLARGVVAGTVVYPIIFAVMIAAIRVWPPRRHPLEDWIREDPSGHVALMALLSAVLLAPAVEELLFRGLLQGWLIRLWNRRQSPGTGKPEAGAVALALEESDAPAQALLPDPGRSPWSAPTTPLAPARPGGAPVSWAPLVPNLLTSAVFAAVHVSEWPAPLPLFVLSLILGYLFERTGGLLAPFALHATFNAISTLLLFVSVLVGGETTPAPVPRTAGGDGWPVVGRARADRVPAPREIRYIR